VRTNLSVVREVAVLDDSRQMGMSAAGRAGSPGLLSASSRRPPGDLGVGLGVGMGGGGFGFATEQLLFEESVLGLEFGDALLELDLALSAALVHGLVVVGLLPQLDGLESMGAGRGRGIG
jgi:hypothetical protein